MYDYRGGLVWDFALILLFIVLVLLTAPSSKYENVTHVTRNETSAQACQRLWDRYPDMRTDLGDCNG